MLHGPGKACQSHTTLKTSCFKHCQSASLAFFNQRVKVEIERRLCTNPKWYSSLPEAKRDRSSLLSPCVTCPTWSVDGAFWTRAPNCAQVRNVQNGVERDAHFGLLGHELRALPEHGGRIAHLQRNLRGPNQTMADLAIWDGLRRPIYYHGPLRYRLA